MRMLRVSFVWDGLAKVPAKSVTVVSVEPSEFRRLACEHVGRTLDSVIAKIDGEVVNIWTDVFGLDVAGKPVHIIELSPVIAGNFIITGLADSAGNITDTTLSETIVLNKLVHVGVTREK